jgi:aromatic ring-opening dioxygenase catalytic subunit (LigB family)
MRDEHPARLLWTSVRSGIVLRAGAARSPPRISMAPDRVPFEPSCRHRLRPRSATDRKLRMTVLPTFYIPHGGGPCFFMEWTLGPPDTWNAMAAWLRGLGGAIGARPHALLVVSAHWEADPVALTGAPQPPLYYDYYGFPEHTYRLTWPAPGDPRLAAAVTDLLGAAGIACRVDPQRGLDHGVFIPFKLIYPQAEVPVVEMSLHAGLDAAFHLRVGAALAPLRERGVLIVGSGMSYHNNRALMGGGDPRAASTAFDAWLNTACALPEPARSAALAGWEQAPGARAAHPREEHLLPLMVAAGAGGGQPGRAVYRDRVLGAAVSGFCFGAPA